MLVFFANLLTFTHLRLKTKLASVATLLLRVHTFFIKAFPDIGANLIGLTGTAPAFRQPFSSCLGSSGRRNTLREKVAMAVRKRRSDRSGRGALPSPGRPSVARREDHRQFWAAIAAGRSREDAAVGAGVSPAVGARLFPRAGGMPPSHLAPAAKPLSARSLA